ncbi:hypothetical protein CCP3SC1_700006 [Gammaproteobacteria bacterium]
MKLAPMKENETARLAALQRYEILDTPPEPEFDEFTRLAAQICNTPIALISLVDTERQWFKSRFGIDAPETPRDISFCGHAIHDQKILEVPNALEDERFSDNPLVISTPNIRFYAGTPLVTSDGHGIGTLCVIDRTPHNLNDAQRDALTTLGKQIIQQLEMRQSVRRESSLNKKLIELTQRLEQATQSADMGIWEYNPATQELIWDDGMYHLYQIEPNEFEGVYAAWSSRIHPEDLMPTEEILEAALRGERNYDTIFRILGKNGAIRFIKASASVLRDPAGQPQKMIGTNHDITKQKLSESALQDQVQYTQTILDNVIDGIITIDEHGIVASLNKAAERIFGFAPDEVLGKNIKMLMPDPYHSQHDSYLANYCTTGVTRVIVLGREIVGQRRNGDTFPMDLAVSEIVHADKRMFVGLVRDISERKRAERMKSEFVSTVSHELRTPLTSIAGTLGLIIGGALGELPPQMKSLLDIALKNSQRLTDLINDLLDMEKIAAGKLHFEMQVLPLMPLVEQALTANKSYGERYHVQFDISERIEDIAVQIDSQRFQQILSNFLSNAAKFSPEGGHVEISVRRWKERVKVAVSDHGPGSR